MVLVVGEHLVKEVPSSTAGVYSTWPQLKDTGHALASLPLEPLGGRGLLYLRPRELAVTAPHDDAVQLLGTDDATTSVMAVLRHTGSGAVGLAHFDKCSHEECLGGGHVCSHDEGVLQVLGRVSELSLGYSEGRLELCVVGGFHDRRGVAEKVTLSLLTAFHKCGVQIHLVLLCSGDCNTTVRGNTPWPIVKGIAVSTQTGKLFPASFTDKGPYLVIRSTRVFTGAQQMVNVYDCALGLLRIGPFNYEPHVGVELLLQQTDDVILRCLSPSPEVEGPGWVKLVREVLKHIKDHPFPAVTIFPDNEPHYFRRDRLGSWVPVELPNNNDSTPDANIAHSISIMASAAAAAVSPPTPSQTVAAGGNPTISVPAVPSTPGSAAWTPPISSSTGAPPTAAQAPPLQAHPLLQHVTASPSANVPQQQAQQQQQPPQQQQQPQQQQPQQQQQPPHSAPGLWGSSPPNHGIPPRYGALHLDCKLKTHLTGPVVAVTPHYDEQLLNAQADRFMPSWQTSQL